MEKMEETMMRFRVDYELKRYKRTPSFVFKRQGSAWVKSENLHHCFDASDEMEAELKLLCWRREEEAIPVDERFTIFKREVEVLNFTRTEHSLPA